MPAQSLDGILRARWTKAATRSARQYFQRGKRDLINSDQSDEKIFHSSAGGSFKNSGRRKIFRPGKQAGAVADLDKIRAHFSIGQFCAGRVGDPDGPQCGREIMLRQAVKFTQAPLDAISHHGLAAAFGNNECGFPKIAGLKVPVAAEGLSAQTPSLCLELRKVGPFAQDGGPGKLKLRCGVQTGGLSFSASAGYGLWPGGGQGWRGRFWCGCGPKSQTGVSDDVSRVDRSVS